MMRFLRDARGFTGAERALLIAFALAIVTLVGALISRGGRQAGSDAAQVLREHGTRAPGRLQAVGEVPHAGDVALPRSEAEPAKADKDLPELVTAPDGAYDKDRRPYQVGEPTEVKDYAFRSGKADALKYVVEIDGAKIPVYLPKNPDKDAGNIHTIQEIAKGLAALPPESRRLVRLVAQNPGRNPEDAMWIKQYGDPKFRSYQTADAYGNVSIYPTLEPVSQTNLDTTLIHETGHTLSLSMWGNPSESWNIRWNPWKSAIAKDKAQVSRYGSASIAEDFSEALALYITYRGQPEEGALRKKYPNRFKILDGLVGKK